MPQVSLNALNQFNKSKLVVKDQWASHPSTEDRIVRLEQTGLKSTNINYESENSLFTDIIKTQKEFTDKLFEDIVYENVPSNITCESFQNEY